MDEPPVTSTTTGSPQTASARERRSPWLLRYMFPQLPLPLPRTATPEKLTEEQTRWSVRGETRTRATFADPHPDDFQGGLPIPQEYPG